MATVHFQQGLSLAQFMRDYGTEAKCYCAPYNVLEREAPRRLDGFVQIDDAYPGGERNGGKTGRDAPGKQPLQWPWRRTLTWSTHAMPLLEPVPMFDNVSLTDWCEHRLVPGAEVYSDGLACFARCIDTGYPHRPRTEGRRTA